MEVQYGRVEMCGSVSVGRETCESRYAEHRLACHSRSLEADSTATSHLLAILQSLFPLLPSLLFSLSFLTSNNMRMFLSLTRRCVAAAKKSQEDPRR
jgi:hypothetical protein